ncbi:MAG: diiron oxygenase [Planctomycetes bacterium]|nr:diiron oxygenase [Planctomycetota bacterium]
MARLGVETLEALNKKSVSMAYSIDDLDWARPIDRSKRWSPDGIAPLTHLPSYARLGPEHRLRYNQLFAVGVCEQFVWFEQHLLVPVLQRLLAEQPDMPPLLREALEHFVIEEHKHSEMFWRMCEKAEPAMYPAREFELFNVSGPQGLALNFLLARPRTFLLWIWAAIFFEERTVDYCRQYRRAEKAAPGELDASFVELHEFHFKDEARHYQLDQHLLTWLYDPEPMWKRRLAARMFKVLMRSYVSPRRTSRRILEVLGAEFPDLKAAAIPALLAELPLLRTSRSFHQAAFSRDAVGKTMELFAEYPEHDGLWELFVLEGKHGPREVPV